MKVIRILASAVVFAAVLGVGTATAQDTDRRELERRLRELREQVRELERELGQSSWNRVAVGGMPRVLTLSQNRAQLGVYVRQRADEETDPIGAVLSGVDPGGPADDAGLQQGDIITSLDGESLVGRYPPADRGQSEPARKLVDLIGDMEPGDEVTIEYQRDGERRSTTATLKERDAWVSILGDRSVPIVSPAPIASPRVEIRSTGPEGNLITILRGGFWSDIELVALNEELGTYFGTDQGLLVIQAPDDDDLDLRGGDVILSIDGREPRTPSRALRILQSYEEGETADLAIMRNRQRMTVTVTVPERRGWGSNGMWDGNGLWESDGGVWRPNRSGLRGMF